eukprot:8405149-Pyramimonas_sp.AAC.1
MVSSLKMRHADPPNRSRTAPSTWRPGHRQIHDPTISLRRLGSAEYKRLLVAFDKLITHVGMLVMSTSSRHSRSMMHWRLAHAFTAPPLKTPLVMSRGLGF